MPTHPISIPNPATFTPRDYQMPFWAAIDGGIKRALLVWHRRAGKDWVILNKVAEKILVTYWDTPITVVYLAGRSQRHGAGIVWDNRTNEGLSYLDAFPPELIERKDDRNYTLYFKNGSIFKVMTTVDKQAARGMNPKIVVFSEYDFIDTGPYIWTSVMLPILLMNDGEAYFTTTPDGVKQTHKMYCSNYDNPEWFVELRDCEHTRHNGQRVLTERMIEQAKREGMSEAKIRQEFWCDFFAESEGTFYQKEFEAIRKEERICALPYDPALPVHTFWDLGMDDYTAIWFAQVDHLGNWRWIDYHQDNGKGLPVYIRELQRKPYTYGLHIAPHDIKVRELGTGQTRLETGLKFGIRFNVAPKLDFQDGIEACRGLLARSHFDQMKTAQGVEGLRHYRKKESNLVDQFGNPLFSKEPVHDWASHPSDAYRTAAVCRRLVEDNNTLSSTFGQDLAKLPLHAKSDYDILGY
jgi:phage terminase large subunit